MGKSASVSFVELIAPQAILSECTIELEGRRGKITNSSKRKRHDRSGGVDPQVLGSGILIQITPQLRILVAVEPIDARKGIDSLAQLCREKLAADPFSGCLLKSSRWRIDVNVDELDRIIDGAMRAPLSESDCQKLKTALHAMAKRLVPRRSTEKTSAVLETVPAAAAQPDTASPRQEDMAAMARGIYRGKESRRRACQAALRRHLPGMPRRKSVPPEGSGNADPHRGPGAAGSDRVRDGAAAL